MIDNATELLVRFRPVGAYRTLVVIGRPRCRG